MTENDSSSRKKLREAEYFLVQLRANERDTRLDQEVFDFNLSAFFSAGRSVTFMLQKENKAAYDAWFGQWFATRSQSERDLFNFMKDQRNVVVKQDGTAERERVVELVDVRLTSDSRAERRHPAMLYMSLGFENAKVGVARHYFTVDDKKLSVVDLCAEYVRVLRELVKDFYASIPKTAT